MRTILKAALAAAGSIVFAGTAIAADRPVKQDVHLLRILFPDGSVQHVRYRGENPFTLIAIPVRTAPAPVARRDKGMSRHFVMLDRLMADMDRRADAMFRQALLAQRSAANGQSGLAVARGLPAGTVRYSFTSVSNGAEKCSHSVRLISLGPDRAPEIVSQSAGDCAGTPDPASSRPLRAKAAPQSRPDLRNTV